MMRLFVVTILVLLVGCGKQSTPTATDFKTVSKNAISHLQDTKNGFGGWFMAGSLRKLPTGEKAMWYVDSSDSREHDGKPQMVLYTSERPTQLANNDGTMDLAIFESVTGLDFPDELLVDVLSNEAEGLESGGIRAVGSKTTVVENQIAYQVGYWDRDLDGNINSEWIFYAVFLADGDTVDSIGGKKGF